MSKAPSTWTGPSTYNRWHPPAQGGRRLLLLTLRALVPAIGCGAARTITWRKGAKTARAAYGSREVGSRSRSPRRAACGVR